MVELVSGEVTKFYKQEKDTCLVDQMVRYYENLVSYILTIKKGGGIVVVPGVYMPKNPKEPVYNLTNNLKKISFAEIKANCQPQSKRNETVQRIINQVGNNKMLGDEATFEEFLFVNRSRIEADYYNLSRYLLEEISTGKVDIGNHKKALKICQTKQRYLDFCNDYMSGYYEYVTNPHNTKVNITKTRLSYEINRRALENGYALLTAALHDKDLSSKLGTFRNNYFVSSNNIYGYVYREKTLTEKIFKNHHASDTKWSLAAKKALDLVINTIKEKKPDLINQDEVFQKVK